LKKVVGMVFLERMSDFCRDRQAKQLFRTLQDTRIFPDGRAEYEGRKFINFAGNDYLGLSRHPALVTAAQAALSEDGVGVTASRLVTGNHPLYGKIEQLIAKGKNQPAALVFSSGYLANLSVIAALADKVMLQMPVVIFADRLCHYSLLQGAQLAQARLIRFRHNDLQHLEDLLTQHTQDCAKLIITESVFGMDGDRADLEALAQLAKEHAALLYVDEAHATGVFGPHGFGLAASIAVPHVVAMGTFGKALGSAGAYVACHETVRDYLLQRCGGMIYSTGLPPSTLASIAAALEILPTLDAQRAHLLRLADSLRQALKAKGFDCGQSTTQILPILLGSAERALAMSQYLRTQGFLVPAIRPPTVPPQTSRLRLSLSAVHTDEDVARFVAALTKDAQA
jgi:8-amino-7-oxononanoate synthase